MTSTQDNTINSNRCITFADASETRFAEAANRDDWNGIIAPVGFERPNEFQDLYVLLAEAIRADAPAVIAANGGIKLLSADSVMRTLNVSKYGITFELDEYFIQECIGRRCLCLPSIEIDGAVYHALHMAHASHGDNAVFQNQLNALSQEERRRLLVN